MSELGTAFRLRRPVSTMRFYFPKGKYVRGYREDDGCWHIWPPSDPGAFVIGIPRYMLRLANRKKRRRK